MMSAGFPYNEISLRVGRTIEAVRKRASVLRIAYNGRVTSWTLEEDNKLQAMRDAGKSYSHIGRSLNRNCEVVKQRWLRLKYSSCPNFVEPVKASEKVSRAKYDNLHYLAACMREMGTKTVGELRARYSQANELKIVSDNPTLSLPTSGYHADTRSLSGSQGAMCAEIG